MKKWHAFGTGLTWAFAWSFVGTSFVRLLGVSLEAAVNLIGPYAMMGLIGGGAFSVGRRRFDEMSLPRFAAWGAVGGLLLSVPISSGLTLQSLVTGSVTTLLGAGSAAGSLALARRANEMSLPRFAAWGAVAGLLVSMPSWSTLGEFSLGNVLMLGVLVLMCAGSAAALLALARNAHHGDLLESGESAGLIEGE